MIHEEYYKKASVARRYFLLKTGEDLSNEVAWSRWRMTRNPDKDILNKVIDEIYKEQKKALK